MTQGSVVPMSDAVLAGELGSIERECVYVYNRTMPGSGVNSTHYLIDASAQTGKLD